MANDSTADRDPGMTALLQGIVADAEKLVRQQLDLFREEVRDEAHRAARAAAAGAAGVGMLAVSGVLGAKMVVHGVHTSTKLPLWACYGLVGGALGGAGLGLLRRARRQVADVRLGLPRQTTQSLRENVEWIKQQTGRA